MCSHEEEGAGHLLVEKGLLVMTEEEAANAAAELVLLWHGLMMEKQLTASKAGGEHGKNRSSAGELVLARLVDGGPSPKPASDGFLEVSPGLGYRLQSALGLCFGSRRRTLQAVQPLAVVLSIHDGCHLMDPYRR